MKIQTNAGEVELTADMVRPGMVFQWGRFTFTIRDPESEWLMGDERVGGRDLPRRADALIGCDPDIAAREDVERYGVAPGIDAGAHGFARLRDGGAADLEDPESFCRGMVFEIVGAVHGSRRGLRFVLAERVMGDGNGGASWECWGDGGGDWRMWKAVRAKEVRFVGLDWNRASPEDVERLCCGALAGVGTTGTVRCTLAIGDHAEHEDIATCTRWPAKVAPPDASKWTPIEGVTPIAFGPNGGVPANVTACCACGGPAPDGLAALRILAQNERGENEKGALCQPCGERLRAGGEYRFEKGRLVAAPAQAAARAEVAPALPPIPYAAVRAWLMSLGYTVRPDAHAGYERFERGDGHWMCLLVDGRSAEDEHDVEFFAGEMRLPAAEVRAGLLATADALGAVALLSWICGMSLGARRRAAEAPLVALVKAVPSWANPVGWRAAVLAVHEVSGDRPTPDTWADAECEKAIRIMVAIGVAADAYSDVERIALDAYARAVAPPGPRPKPERKSGMRPARLVVDNGEG